MNLQLTAISDGDFFTGFAIIRANCFHALNDIHAVDDGSKDNVFSIQPGGLDCAQEELRSVGVGSSVGHRQDSGTSVLQGEVLIGEFSAVDGFATSSIVSGEVTPLAHEARDDTMERGILESESLLTSAKLAEVLGSLGHYIGAKLQIKTVHLI